MSSKTSCTGNTFSHGILKPVEPQYIVFDLEATCWLGPAPNGQNEIIEIGALKVDFSGHVVSEFSRFVKPVLNPLLSPFCKSLTRIPQEKIDQARTFKYVYREFMDWVDEGDDPTFYISWGENDYAYFKNDCRLHQLEDQWIENHVDLRKHFKALKRLNNHVSLKKALVMENMDFSGQRHRAFDDAYNLSRIFIRYLDDWNFY